MDGWLNEKSGVEPLPSPDFMEKVGVISAFYKIFGQRFERLKQRMIWAMFIPTGTESHADGLVYNLLYITVS